MQRFHQKEFNGLKEGYYRNFRSRKICKHTPQELRLYRLSLVMNLGVVIGFIIKHI